MTIEHYENLAFSLGLSKEEYRKIQTLMGHTPTEIDVTIFALAWLHHDMVSSSRLSVTNLHRQKPYFLPSREDNFGLLALDDGQEKLGFTTYSSYLHPHDEALEKGKKAASKLLKSLFRTNIDPRAVRAFLQFGEDAESQDAAQKVLLGIKSYLEIFGITEFSSKTHFHKSFKSSALITLFGIGQTEEIRFHAPSLANGSVLLYGEPAFSPEENIQENTQFNAQNEEEESILLRHLRQSGSIYGFEDIEKGGILRASLRLLKKTGLGLSLELDKVPFREEMKGASPADLLLEQRKGAFLLVVEEEKRDSLKKLFEEKSFSLSVIGKFSDIARLSLYEQGEKKGDVPLAALFDEAPLLQRDAFIGEKPFPLSVPADPVGIEAALKTLLASSDLSMENRGIGKGDYQPISLKSDVKLFLSTECQARYTQSDAYLGAASSVMSAWRKLIARGVKPLGFSSFLNFDLSENTHIMGQFIRVIEGIKEAQNSLNLPLLAKNVSFCHEQKGKISYAEPILPSPFISFMGILEKEKKMIPFTMPEEGELLLIGESRGDMGQSLWLKEIYKRQEGAPPHIDFRAEKALAEFLQREMALNYIEACHDVSEGGLLIAIAQMALASGVGCALLSAPKYLPLHAYWYSEEGGRYLVATKEGERFFDAAEKAKIPVRRLGVIGGAAIKMHYGAQFPLKELAEINNPSS